MNALVVDDSRAIQMILTKTLAKLGFGEIQEASTGEEALACVAGRPSFFGLILVDWNMPGISGLEFVRRFRSDESNASVCLVMVTTETQIEQMVAALEAGANEYVMKPFTADIIADKLRLLGILEPVI